MASDRSDANLKDIDRMTGVVCRRVDEIQELRSQLSDVVGMLARYKAQKQTRTVEVAIVFDPDQSELTDLGGVNVINLVLTDSEVRRHLVNIQEGLLGKLSAKLQYLPEQLKKDLQQGGKDEGGTT